MRVLFDNNIPRRLRRSLKGHEVHTAREKSWATLRNGDLLRAAEDAGYDVMVTADQDLFYQQNLGPPSRAGCPRHQQLERHPASLR